MSTALGSAHPRFDSRMSCTSWIPANPDACARLLPRPLKPAENRAVYLSQCVVGPASLTCLALDVAGHFTPGGAAPARFVTHHLGSSERARALLRELGLPAASGSTTLEVKAGVMTATTYDEGTAIIRTRASVGSAATAAVAGELRYITGGDDRLVSSFCPYLAERASPYELLSIEFLEPGHPVYALRPPCPWSWCPPPASTPPAHPSPKSWRHREPCSSPCLCASV